MVRSVVAKKSPKQKVVTANQDLLPPVPSSFVLEKWDDGTTKTYYLCWETRQARHKAEVSQKVFEALSVKFPVT
jgi:hypothetical protein